jgi:hypothetical protein
VRRQVNGNLWDPSVFRLESTSCQDHGSVRRAMPWRGRLPCGGRPGVPIGSWAPASRRHGAGRPRPNA